MDNLSASLWKSAKEEVEVPRSNALDVASYILGRDRNLTTLQLQKLVYYAQAWSLAWDGQPLFDDRIEAWQNGPVVPRLFNAHRKRRWVSQVDGGSADRLSPADKAKIDAVLDFYGEYSADDLVRMTHEDAPWVEAWGDRAPEESGSAPVREQTMRHFYTVQQLMGAPAPKRPESQVAEAPLDVAMDEAGRQMRKWRSTLDWLAVR